MIIMLLLTIAEGFEAYTEYYMSVDLLGSVVPRDPLHYLFFYFRVLLQLRSDTIKKCRSIPQRVVHIVYRNGFLFTTKMGVLALVE